ncbi:MAG: pantoate--beta-alanine ligase [Clostridiales Family XIII bacterium]|jgi:pantoate--beta-alanine ligase|nr:pantoate--beta-alanine ligase [Clostridiales Family XIII bacterium]
MGIKIFDTVGGVKEALAAARAGGQTVGFVPTMGALHAGHISLIERSAAENGCTAVSIFVNPLQFGEGEDLEKYPQTLDADIRACENAGAEMVFVPRAAELYPAGFSTYVDMTGLTDALCGRARPRHFRGVMTVVTKLFNIIRPDRAYFGEKDAQQLVIIRKLARDLDMGVEVIGCPTVREADGLAMSSRNIYLSPDERKAATCLYRALLRAAELAEEHFDDNTDVGGIISEVRAIIEAEPLARLEYAELVDAELLTPVTKTSRAALLAIAAHIGGTRLIDAITLRWPQ